MPLNASFTIGAGRDAINASCDFKVWFTVRQRTLPRCNKKVLVQTRQDRCIGMRDMRAGYS
jgi:hypothetical protein